MKANSAQTGRKDADLERKRWNDGETGLSDVTVLTSPIRGARVQDK